MLTALFRTYTGLFADYVFIEEKALASACGLSEEVLYEKLMALNRARLLHYIPHKSVSTLRYLTRRTLGERLNIGADAYETRLDQYTRRIEGVVRYCTDRDTCRSRMLLEYFDDPAAHDCGRCDVCRPTPELARPMPNWKRICFDSWPTVVRTRSPNGTLRNSMPNAPGN